MEILRLHWSQCIHPVEEDKFEAGFRGMGTMEEKREAKRLSILKAAKEEFLSAGYEAANMDEIAALASVTKQTVYRYFPSKIELFEATIIFLGQSSNADFVRHLEHPNPRKALVSFAKGFMRWHLEDEPLCVFRLLVTESAKSPEIVETFFKAAPDETSAALSKFLRERLSLSDPDEVLLLYTSMLFAFRDDVLFGRGRPGEEEIARFAEAATRMLLADLKLS
ncbi:TetR/AcrR family transcriptional regulator [Ruegeria sp. EL01]|jgi:TetR/AcrR family transcriptional regulator of autoinduction and epiphytic fitness|uniref:TetR/AcrR family transcriptional regulator n=1 Tax=Ruegeria sp. EL01 TaxID=2107578 RepID=UPI000EA812E5|nr:TetR/AcrR family transcriptional regulator [Ruegeria sp. EL01]